MAMLTTEREAVPPDVDPEVLGPTTRPGDDSTPAPERRGLGVRVPRLARGSRTNWARVAYLTVLTVFVGAILASYAVPLWFQVRGERLLVVTSGSMSPEIEAGDAVVIQQVTLASQLRVGQIVTFYPTGSSVLITHRIVSLARVERVDDAGNPVLAGNGKPIVDPYIKTKGDANDSADPNLTPAASVRGIVREVYPRWGFGLAWAHSGVGRLVLFGPPLLALAISELLSRSGTSLSDVVARVRGRRQSEPSPGAPVAGGSDAQLLG